MYDDSLMALPNPPAFTKPQRVFQPHDALAAIGCMVLGFLLVRYLLFNTDGFVTSAVFLLMFFCTLWYHRKCGYKALAGHRLLGSVICLFACSFSVTASPLPHTLTAVFLIIAMCWYHYAVAHGHSRIPRFFFFYLTGLHTMDEFSAGYEIVGKSLKNSKVGSKVRIIVVGLLISLPLTLLVAALLSSADAGVAEVLRRIGKLFTEDFFEILWEILFGLLVGAWMFAAMYCATNNARYPEICDAVFEQRLEDKRIIPTLGLCASVTPICLLYTVYVISQISYFCSAFFGKLPDTMSYAEYARRGFFELCAIAVLNLLVILVATGCCKRTEGKQPTAAKIYGCVLCLFTLFIIATAIAKMVLYIDAYGLTRLRLYTTWFMVLLAIVFVVILAMQFTHKIHPARILVTSFIVLFTLLVFSRPDALVAEYNITRWQDGTLKNPDWELICSLSDDAYTVICNHWDELPEEQQAYVISKYNNRRYALQPETTWNLSTQYLLYAWELNHE
ncbi:MAG: DUF4173 domain-containing protein [Oscillospiraceae bacterium]|nr:DUF4173 domain-containing protein [Oscillospiraceae bacterium]